MKTKADLLERCKSFDQYATEYASLEDIELSPDGVVLGIVSFPSGLKLPFCFVGSRSLDQREGAEGSITLENSRKSDELTIVFSGAVSRGTIRPTFHRISWFESFNGNALYFADPVLDCNPDIELGWYIGYPQWKLMEAIAEIIEHARKALKIKQSYVYGSSGGGYAAISLARYMSNLNIISINPQIYLENWIPGVLRLFSSKVFNEDREQFIEQHPELNNVTIGLQANANRNRILIYQNLTDSWREGHVAKLLDERSDLLVSGAVKVEYFSRPIDHSAEKIGWVREIFAYIEKWDSTKLHHTES